MNLPLFIFRFRFVMQPESVVNWDYFINSFEISAFYLLTQLDLITTTLSHRISLPLLQSHSLRHSYSYHRHHSTYYKGIKSR